MGGPNLWVSKLRRVGGRYVGGGLTEFGDPQVGARHLMRVCRVTRVYSRQSFHQSSGVRSVSAPLRSAPFLAPLRRVPAPLQALPNYNLLLQLSLTSPTLHSLDLMKT